MFLRKYKDCFTFYPDNNTNAVKTKVKLFMRCNKSNRHRYSSCWTCCPVFVLVQGIFAQQTHQSCTLHTGLNAGNSDTKQTTNILQYIHFCQCISVIVFIKKRSVIFFSLFFFYSWTWKDFQFSMYHINDCNRLYNLAVVFVILLCILFQVRGKFSTI